MPATLGRADPHQLYVRRFSRKYCVERQRMANGEPEVAPDNQLTEQLACRTVCDINHLSANDQRRLVESFQDGAIERGAVIHGAVP